MLASPQPRCSPASSRARWAPTLPGLRRDHDRVEVGAGQLAGHHRLHGAGRGVGLQAAAAAAAAQRALVVEGEVADLAGRAAGAVEELVVDDDAGADAGGDLHEDRAVVAAADARAGARPARRGWRRSRRARGRRTAARRPRGCRRPPSPGRSPRSGRRRWSPARAARGRRGAPARAPEPSRRASSRPGRAPRAWSWPAVEAPALLGEQVAGQVAERDGDVAVAEVDAGDQAGGPGQPDGGAAAPAARVGLDQAGRGELAHDVGDRRRREAGGPGQLGLRERRRCRRAGGARA